MRLLATTVMLLALPGLSGAAEVLEDWNYGPLYDDWRISRVMLGTVETSDEVYGGDVHDIIIGETGLVKSVVVEWYQPGEMDRAFFEVNWANLDFTPRLGEVEVKLSAREIEKMDKAESPEFATEEEYEASNLIGMPVALDDKAPYGEITDLLVSETANDLTAYIIKSDGPGLMEYAVPATEDAIDYQQGLVKLPYVIEEVEDLDVFLYDRANQLREQTPSE